MVIAASLPRGKGACTGQQRSTHTPAHSSKSLVCTYRPVRSQLGTLLAYLTSLPYPKSMRYRSQRAWPRTDSRSPEAPLCPCMSNQELDPYLRLADTSSCIKSLRSTGKIAHSSTGPEHSTDRPLQRGPPSGTPSNSAPQVSP